ncbi:MAG: hypothetical protein AABM32_12530 [Chloroflexota bacterium]
MARLLGAVGVVLFAAVVVVTALAVRGAPLAPTAATDSAAGSGAAPAMRIAPMFPLRFGPGFDGRSARISPDGTLATAMTTDWSAEGLFALSDDASNGFVVAREIMRFAPGAGQVWLSSPTALLVPVSQPTKRSLLKVIGGDGKTIELGTAEFTGTSAVSPDGQWIAIPEGLSQPSQIRIFDRTGSVAPRVIASGTNPIVGGIQFDATGRVLFPNGRTVVATDPSGHETIYPLASDASAFGVVGMSPDRSVAVIGVNTSTGEDLRILEGGSVRALLAAVIRPVVWVGPHEMLARKGDDQLFAVDSRGGERDLGVAMKASDVRVLAYSAPFLLWVDNSIARVRVHLTDLALAKDVTVGANPVPTGAQPNGDGRFLITRDDVNFGADVLSGASWFASLPPTPAPVATRAGAAVGYQRIASDEGGWSMEIPEKWVAETGNLRGAEIASFELQGADFSGNLPAPDQLRIRVTVMPEYDHLSLAELGAKGGLSSPGPVIEQLATTVAGQQAMRTVMRSGSPPPFDMQHVHWHFRSPFFADRVVVVDAWPADGALRAVADRAIGTLALSQPKVTVATPISRQDAIDRATDYLRTIGRIDRVAAKLVGYHEYEVASNSGRSYTQDPDDLVWVVVTAGEFVSTHSGPLRVDPGQPKPDRVIVQALQSSTGQYFSGMYSSDNTWPSWFDGLKDRAP